jgi:tryptophanyl-tRNA synthetase
MSPIKKRTAELLADKSYLDKLLKESAEKASVRAERTLRDVYDSLGFVL